ncbi:DUF1761 domain-containing protein [Candidatus Peregrinibacteria bacterium]|nr:MAG: DUF1761 domain-containing protein [Candidatus Peregrinibacteria bacterium]
MNLLHFGPILLAAVLTLFLGMAWYSEALFGKAWMKAVGLTKQKNSQSKRLMLISMILGFVSSLVTAMILDLLLTLMGVTAFSAAYVFTFWLWLGFSATGVLGQILWEMRPPRLFFINGIYQLLALLF